MADHHRDRGADQLDHAKARIASKARDIKDAAQHRVDQAQRD